jgi:hypothetical protein
MSSDRERGTDPFGRFNDDPTRHKHGGTDTSRVAWEKARTRRADCQQEVLNALRSVHPKGLTCKELSAVLNKAMHKISGRITELLEDGLVHKGEIHNGGRVIYLETAESSARRDSQPAGDGRVAQKAEIEHLYDAGEYWKALELARNQNINCTMEWDIHI